MVYTVIISHVFIYIYIDPLFLNFKPLKICWNKVMRANKPIFSEDSPAGIIRNQQESAWSAWITRHLLTAKSWILGRSQAGQAIAGHPCLFPNDFPPGIGKPQLCQLCKPSEAIKHPNFLGFLSGILGKPSSNISNYHPENTMINNLGRSFGVPHDSGIGNPFNRLGHRSGPIFRIWVNGQESWCQIHFGGLIILFCRFQRILNSQKKSLGPDLFRMPKIPRALDIFLGVRDDLFGPSPHCNNTDPWSMPCGDRPWLLPLTSAHRPGWSASDLRYTKSGRWEKKPTVPYGNSWLYLMLYGCLSKKKRSGKFWNRFELYLVDGWPTPLKNHGVHQLGWWNIPIWMGK